MDTLLRLSPRPPSCTRLPTDPCGNNGCNFWLPVPLVIQLEIFYSFHSKMASTLRTRMHVIHEPCIWPSLTRGLCSSLFRASDLLRKVTGSIIVRGFLVFTVLKDELEAGKSLKALFFLQPKL